MFLRICGDVLVMEKAKESLRRHANTLEWIISDSCNPKLKLGVVFITKFCSIECSKLSLILPFESITRVNLQLQTTHFEHSIKQNFWIETTPNLSLELHESLNSHSKMLACFLSDSLTFSITKTSPQLLRITFECLVVHHHFWMHSDLQFFTQFGVRIVLGYSLSVSRASLGFL